MPCLSQRWPSGGNSVPSTLVRQPCPALWLPHSLLTWPCRRLPPLCAPAGVGAVAGREGGGVPVHGPRLCAGQRAVRGALCAGRWMCSSARVSGGSVCGRHARAGGWTAGHCGICPVLLACAAIGSSQASAWYCIVVQGALLRHAGLEGRGRGLWRWAAAGAEAQGAARMKYSLRDGTFNECSQILTAWQPHFPFSCFAVVYSHPSWPCDVRRRVRRLYLVPLRW